MTAARTVDFISHSVAQTLRVAARLAAQFAAGDVVLLEGTLGSGKTVFARGIAEGLGIEEPVTSPTFTLIHEYREGRLPLYHVDLYRLDERGVADLGLEEYLFGDGVTVIEWADRAAGLLTPDHLLVRLTIVSETKRGIRVAPRGKRYEELVDRFRRDAFGL